MHSQMQVSLTTKNVFLGLPLSGRRPMSMNLSSIRDPVLQLPAPGMTLVSETG